MSKPSKTKQTKRFIDHAEYYYHIAIEYRKAGYNTLAVESWKISKACKQLAIDNQNRKKSKHDHTTIHRAKGC